MGAAYHARILASDVPKSEEFVESFAASRRSKMPPLLEEPAHETDQRGLGIEADFVMGGLRVASPKDGVDRSDQCRSPCRVTSIAPDARYASRSPWRCPVPHSTTDSLQARPPRRAGANHFVPLISNPLSRLRSRYHAITGWSVQPLHDRLHTSPPLVGHFENRSSA